MLKIAILCLYFFSSTQASTFLSEISGKSYKNQSQITIKFKHTQQAKVVIFLSSKCPCSQSHRLYLNELVTKYPTVTFYGIHSTEEEFNNHTDYHFEIIKDKGFQVADLFKASRTPHAFLISPQGEIVYSGGVTNSSNPTTAKEYYLEAALNEWINHKPISKPTTRTLGCSISRF